MTGNDIENDPIQFEITQSVESGELILLNAASGECMYSPFENANGLDQFSYRVFDGMDYSEEVQVTLSVYAVNDLPIALPGTIEMQEDQSYSGKVSASDADNDDLIFSIYQTPKKGNLVISETGAGQGNFVFTPYLNANGQDVFWFHVFDGEAYSDPQPFTISIIPVNDAPKAADFMEIINAGETLEWLLNASDPEADPITFMIAQQPEKGVVQILDPSTGIIQFTASEMAQGQDILTFKVTDGSLESNEATVTISINPADNHQPIANPQKLTVTEGIASYFTLDAHDSDSNPLKYFVYQEPTKGTFSFSNDNTGESVYEPFLNASGMDRIVYYVNDSIVNSEPAYLTMIIQSMPETVIPKHDILSIPVVLSEEKTIESLNLNIQCDPEKLKITGMTLDNTILSAGDYAFSVQIDEDSGFAVFPISSQGTAISAKGTVAYILLEVLGSEGDITLLDLPKLTCNENRVFGGFQVDGSVSSKIRLMINELPIAYEGYLIIDEDKDIEYQLIGFDVNMADPISYTIVSYPEKGSLTLVDADNGKCIFVTTPNAYGSDEFIYQSFDGKDYSLPAKINITINPINDKPVAFPKSLTVSEDIPKSIVLSAEDPADPEDILIFKIQQKPANGVAIMDPYDGVCMYQNNENYYGMDSFTYVADDGIEKSDPMTVNIMVMPVNDAPIPESVTQTTREDTPLTFEIKATDPENDSFEYSLLREPEKGSLNINATTGHCSYVPNDGISGTDTFQFQATDSNGAISGAATIYIVITPENDPPEITSTSFETHEDDILTATLTATDPENNDITFIFQSDTTTQGTFELNADTGDFTYTPPKDFNGTDTIVIAAKDTWMTSSDVSIPITIHPVNDPPTADAGTDYQVTERLEIILDGSGSSDIDNDELTYLWTVPDIPNLSITNENQAQATLKAPYVETAGQTITVTLTVTDPDQATNMTTTTVQIDNMALPEVSFTANPYSGMVPLNVSFFDQSNGMPEEWFWDFGDNMTSNKQNPSHVYKSPGTYTVQLTVQGPGGENSFTKNQFITVGSQPLSVDFSVNKKQGTVPHTVQFNPDIKGEVDSWQWDFGDGSVSFDFNATHTYQETGAYTVTLTASGPGGSRVKTYDNWIVVTGHIFKGTVTSERLPLVGYRIETYMVDTYVAGTMTDDAGCYTIMDLLPSQQYVVGVWPPENDNRYLYEYYKNAQTLFDATYVGTNGITIIDFELERSPTRKVSGQVTDGTNPIANMQVDIYSDKLGLAKSATTNAYGVYTLTGLKEASDYRVSVYDSDLNQEFFYYNKDMSVKNISQATQISPTEDGLKDIDLIVNNMQGAMIEGDVQDTDSNPIANMRVNAWSDGLNAGGNATTDSNGHYVISGLTPVQQSEASTNGYIVEIQPNGYVYQIYNNTTNKDNAQRVATGRVDIHFTLSQTANMSGTVFNILEEPVADANVQLYSEADPTGTQNETQSDNDGTFSFNEIPIRTDYILRVDANGYPIHYYPNKTNVENTTLLTIAMGALEAVNVTLDKGLIIKGYVHDQIFDEPVNEGTQVSLRSDNQGTVHTALTDANGYYEFVGLNSSVLDYKISVLLNNYLPAFYSNNQDDINSNDTVYSSSLAKSVTPLPQTDAPECHLILIKGGSIKGLVDFQGTPVKGAIVKVQSDTGTWQTTTTDDEAVNYTITGLMANTYQFEIISNAYESISENIEIGTGEDMQKNASLNERPLRSIQGTVHNIETDKQVQIVAQSQSLNIQKTITLVGDGTSLDYAIENLIPASDYILELKSDDYTNQYFDNAYLPDDATVQNLMDGDITDADFSIETDLAEIQGTLTFPSSASNGDKVRLQVKSSSTGVEGFTEIVYAGNETVDYHITGLLPSDDYILQLRSDVYLNRYWDGSTLGNAYPENAAPINVTSGTAVADLVLDAGRSISGIVTDANSNPLKGIQIDVWSDQKKIAAITHTSETGVYIIKGLDESEDYRVKATTSTNAKFYYNVLQSVQIPDNASPIILENDRDDIHMTIKKGEIISGTVQAMSGQAIANIWVNAWSESIKVGSGVFTSDDGSFSIQDLPKVQDYAITVTPEWNMPYFPVEQNNIAAPSDGVNLVLSDKTGFTVTGKITGASGEAVKNATVRIQSASKPDYFGWANTDATGKYTIDLLPQATDYDIQVTPPAASNLAFFRQTIAIQKNIEKNIMLDMGYVFAGVVDGNDAAVPDANVTVWSNNTRFFGEDITNSKGEYEIRNVPMSSDYTITVKAESYLDLDNPGQSPKTGLSHTLTKGGLIKGTVRSLLTGAVVPDASIEVFSQSNQGLEVYNGVATTDKDGNYAVADLKPVDEQGNKITDFVVTVYAVGFPPIAKTGKKLSDIVSFDLTKGPENEISGTITNAKNPVAVDVFEVMQRTPERIDKFIKTVMANDDGTFLIDGLRSDGQFVLKFVTLVSNVEYAEFAGTDDKGVSNSADANLYETQSSLSFEFSSLGKRKRYAAPSILGPVSNLRSISHEFKTIDLRKRATQSSGPDRPSNDASVTVAWEPPKEGSAEVAGYYSFFDKAPEKKD
ncbi:MAG: hypothetical protein OMM_00466 [Candidatus Magnetoglobus multicellularis str. Araruama]|uniref:Uncharacterized protein n=1 Tax=Candidatus Magnetoglobus multicellularis str. Araruama TaxID=890399 RepID=A0A1V1PGT3_9BACT|nr:MAG: hypothetical protein OMM_00466 [Candidatus Magnetoglobus multicellularis str. Araruama]